MHALEHCWSMVGGGDREGDRGAGNGRRRGKESVERSHSNGKGLCKKWNIAGQWWWWGGGQGEERQQGRVLDREGLCTDRDAAGQCWGKCVWGGGGYEEGRDAVGWGAKRKGEGEAVMQRILQSGTLLEDSEKGWDWSRLDQGDQIRPCTLANGTMSSAALLVLLGLIVTLLLLLLMDCPCRFRLLLLLWTTAATAAAFVPSFQHCLLLLLLVQCGLCVQCSYRY